MGPTTRRQAQHQAKLAGRAHAGTQPDKEQHRHLGDGILQEDVTHQSRSRRQSSLRRRRVVSSKPLRKTVPHRSLLEPATFGHRTQIFASRTRGTRSSPSLRTFPLLPNRQRVHPNNRLQGSRANPPKPKCKTPCTIRPISNPAHGLRLHRHPQARHGQHGRLPIKESSQLERRIQVNYVNHASRTDDKLRRGIVRPASNRNRRAN